MCKLVHPTPTFLQIHQHSMIFTTQKQRQCSENSFSWHFSDIMAHAKANNKCFMYLPSDVVFGGRFQQVTECVSSSSGGGSRKLEVRAARTAAAELLMRHSTRDQEPLLGSASIPSVLHKMLYTSTVRMGPARKFVLKSGEKIKHLHDHLMSQQQTNINYYVYPIHNNSLI